MVAFSLELLSLGRVNKLAKLSVGLVKDVQEGTCTATQKTYIQLEVVK